MGEKKSPENTKNHQNVHVLHSNSEVSMSRYIALYLSGTSQESVKKSTFLVAADAEGV